LEEFVSNRNVQPINEKMENKDNALKLEKLDNLLLPVDFEDVLNQGKASTSKELPRKGMNLDKNKFE
jgi:hypothetical protein